MSDPPEKPKAPTTTTGEGPRWAADEPTAMWDESSLKQQGYADVAASPTSPASGPATSPDVGGHERGNVVPERTQQRSQAPAPNAGMAPPPQSGAGLSWPVTVVIATLVAVVVYFVVRMMR